LLPDKIKQLRKKHGLSQEALAEKLDVSRQSISKWESGSSNPDIDYVIKMSNIFGVSTDYLLKETPTSEIKSHENNAPIVNSANKAPLVLGIISSSILLIGLFILKLLSSFFKGVSQATAAEISSGNYEEVSTEVFSGFSGYLKYNNIEWILTLCVILLLISIICFIIYFTTKKKHTR
jgi:transcriptional regulator with XRE-family HTH domain